MNFKSHFKFNKQERSGIFFLLLIIVLLQVAYFLLQSFPINEKESAFALDADMQTKIDLLKEKIAQEKSYKIYPFNPNFITDFKGYSLGMSVEEIDRLHAFRASNKFVNSKEDFQQVTQISDSLLHRISVYFKFPEWTTKSKFSKKFQTYNSIRKKNISKDLLPKDINTATADDLKVISGIGDVLSKRIIKFRDRLGGFLVDEQLYDVYALEPEVIERTLQRFKVLNPPHIEKININIASVETLTKLIYLQRKVAFNIVSYRNSEGSIDSFEELAKIEDFPKEKIDRIALYLTL